MEFTVGNDTRIETAPEEIRASWTGKYAYMISKYKGDNKAFLELFGVKFKVLIPSGVATLENGIDYWIPQAYSSSESEDLI